jgi:alginate O-acetyltransferase complex protein AlgI
MLFNTIPFLYLLVTTFILYYLPFSKRFQLPILISGSFIFYAWNYPTLLFLLLFSIFINASGSYGVVHIKNKTRQKGYAILTILTNLTLLAVFKYAGLIGKTFLPVQHDITDWLITIPLPIGISFFTFQGISLVVDTFRHNKRLESDQFISSSFIKHLSHTCLFISLFPQLVAGPIVKAHDFYKQIKPKSFKDIDWSFVISHLIVGYFLKMVVADNLKDFTFELTYPYFLRLSSPHLLMLVVGYSMQIFADFAGYSLIAIGLSAMFGYCIPINFNYPYISTSFSEFWRRWHISLSSFLKEYLYFPLGGNRKGFLRTYLNLIVVMGLGGLWHGAAWSYMIWGLAHGLLLAIERMFRDFKLLLPTKPIYKVLKGVLVFTFVSFAWLLFKLPDFSQVMEYFKALFNNQNTSGTNPLTYLYLWLYIIPVILYHIYYVVPIKKQLIQRHLKPVLLAFMTLMIFLNSGSPQGFIYFQF